MIRPREAERQGEVSIVGDHSLLESKNGYKRTALPNRNRRKNREKKLTLIKTKKKVVMRDPSRVGY